MQQRRFPNPKLKRTHIRTYNPLSQQASRGRLLKELKEAVKNQESGEDKDIQLFADERNILKWTAKIAGPQGTPYEGGLFSVSITVPEQYPLAPPKANFETRWDRVACVSVSCTVMQCNAMPFHAMF